LENYFRKGVAMKQQESSPVNGWWYSRFRIKWPENTDPSWHIDLLIAQEIIAPLLEQSGKKILLWRFHRRAARDTEGHQFSLTFYSSSDTAKQIFAKLRSSTPLKQMKRAGVILQDIYDDPGKIIAPNIEDTCDGNWSPYIRKSWPFFIMGVCQMWLSLIAEISEGTIKKQKGSSIKKKQELYRQVNETINTLWREQGCHAMLHHLNAIFSYEPILIREVNLRRF
jgi:hypothetical protein